MSGHLSMCLSVTSFACHCSVFAAERRASRRYQSTAAAAGHPAAAVPEHGAQQQMRALSR